ncbi:MAG TPA: hypothetical protein DIC45_11145 [Comamonadaceae bacterium]|uniref:hypothetical protein n=1 Tax=Pulveribacter sp. TaxID=2678893 RepID=UPI000EDC9C67|nr:hypothetical protein [Pulveribacter sp.]HCL87022.1 hypothetical protein [Comamonadaceae bacterium]
MQAIRFALAALVTGLSAQAASAACYIVYGADKQVVYRAQTPPVDMSRQLHETLPLVVPGGTMVFSLDSSGCELEINLLPVAGTSRASLARAGVRAPRAPRG